MGLVPPNTELYIVDLTSLIADVLQIPDWHRGKRANPVSGNMLEKAIFRWSVLQLKHGVFHPQRHGVLQVKKLQVAVQTALLQAVVFG